MLKSCIHSAPRNYCFVSSEMLLGSKQHHTFQNICFVDVLLEVDSFFYLGFLRVAQISSKTINYFQRLVIMVEFPMAYCYLLTFWWLQNCSIAKSSSYPQKLPFSTIEHRSDVLSSFLSSAIAFFGTYKSIESKLLSSYSSFVITSNFFESMFDDVTVLANIGQNVLFHFQSGHIHGQARWTIRWFWKRLVEEREATGTVSHWYSLALNELNYLLTCQIIFVPFDQKILSNYSENS